MSFIISTLDDHCQALANYVLQFVKFISIRSKKMGLSPHIGAAIAHLLTQKYGNQTMQVAHAITSFLQNVTSTGGLGSQEDLQVNSWFCTYSKLRSMKRSPLEKNLNLQKKQVLMVLHKWNITESNWQLLYKL